MPKVTARPDTWMPLYIGDYLADTRRLKAAEHGAYLLLIMEYWQAGGLPDDDRQLARIACMTDREWKIARPIIEKRFQPGWRHKRIDAELAKAAVMSKKRASAGKAGAAARYGKRMALAKEEDGKRMAFANEVDGKPTGICHDNGWQTDGIVRVRNNHNHKEPSLLGESLSPREVAEGEQASAPADLAPTSALLGTKLMQRRAS